ncbi:hypothetical protein SKAU_G00142130 [Synaphobranchus kaupii]|uniref:Uncharacterized protein n=1 Tax=Synaphobranchus kaupii TaxID=118154 RepID=A0A9Q1FTF6_SYNKA|nr:hypothetical protein SKAU_G00142130 [Synaphobranchus kaupii]
MTAISHSLREADVMKLGALNTKTKMRVSLCNVRTMFETGKLAQITNEMRRYQMNNNDERLATFCVTNKLVIGGSLFPHKDIHKLTWCSPNARDKNQIDHLMINAKWRSSLRDVKV